MASPRMTRSSATVSPKANMLSTPVVHQKSPAKENKPPSSGNAMKQSTSPPHGLNGNGSDADSEVDGDNDQSDGSDDEHDGYAPPTSPLATRRSRNGTPLTPENLAKLSSAGRRKDWAGRQKNNDMFQELAPSATSESDSISIPDDDDDYDDVDKVSATSDTPSNESKQFEAEIEQEILAQGEEAIDWDSQFPFGTGRYFGNPGAALWGMSDEDIILGSDIFAATKEDTPNPSNPVPERPLQDFLKGIPIHDDWPSDSDAGHDSSDDDLDQLSHNHGNVRESALEDVGDESSLSSAISDDDENDENDDDADDDEDDDADDDDAEDSTDDEGPVIETIKTPSITLANRPSPHLEAQTEPARRDMRPPETPVPRQPGKFGVMRRFKLNPNKAMAYARSSPSGRVLCFSQPRVGTLRWISARTSRSSSFDSSAESQDPALTAQLQDAIRSRLFRRFACSGPNSPIGTAYGSDFSRSVAFTGSPFHASTRQLAGSAIEDSIASSIEVDAETFIDFEGGHSSLGDEESASETPAPKTTIKHPMAPPPPVTPKAVINQNNDHNNIPRTPDTEVFPTPSQDEQVLVTPSPKKRRNSPDDADHSSTLTPAMKKQRVDSI